MNQVLLSIFFVATLAQQKCTKGNNEATPSCVLTRIEEIKKQPKWNPPATITEYRYNGKTVYLFSANCCDQYNEVVDADCNFVCAPSGGITGKGDGECTDFSDKAEMIRVVWKDDRS